MSSTDDERDPAMVPDEKGQAYLAELRERLIARSEEPDVQEALRNPDTLAARDWEPVQEVSTNVVTFDAEGMGKG